jgi:hypothetical protein
VDEARAGKDVPPLYTPGGTPTPILNEVIDEVSDMEEVDYHTITGDTSPPSSIPSGSPTIATATSATARRAAATGVRPTDVLPNVVASKALAAAASVAWPFWPLPRSLHPLLESPKFSWRLLFFVYRTVRRLVYHIHIHIWRRH